MTTAATTDLAACPFCNEPARIRREAGSWGYYPAKIWVACKKCGAEGATIESGDDNAKAEAVAAWNRRADARVTAIEAENARLREDAARLDWLDGNGFTAYRQVDPIDGLAKHCVVVHETMKPRRGNVASTIREAIDAARGEEG